MTAERELLIDAVEWMQELKYVYADARDSGDRVLLELIADINKIEKLLNQPEHKEEPLSGDEVTELLMGGFSTHLMDLVKMVELAHGIGGE